MSNNTAQLETTIDAIAIPVQNLDIGDNTAKVEFITENGSILSGNLYDAATIKVTMGRFVPTKKFLNEIADTLAADMIDYIKNGGKTNKITAMLVYDDYFKN